MRSPRSQPAAQTSTAILQATGRFLFARGGATLVTEPESHHGSRMYRAIDLEGHRWIFATPLAEA